MAIDDNMIKREIQPLFEQTFDEAGTTTWLSLFTGTMIIIALFLVILETEFSTNLLFGIVTRHIEIFLAFFFTLEYGLWVYYAGKKPRYRGAFGRVKFMLKPVMICDALATIGLYSTLLNPGLSFLRALRLLRLVRLSGIWRPDSAINIFIHAVREGRYMLFVTAILALLIILLGSSLMFLAEGEAQPHIFGSIPRALWWSVITLTTVGYGDAVPVTVLGKIVTGFFSISGVGIIALPTAILASHFTRELEERKKRQEKNLISQSYLRFLGKYDMPPSGQERKHISALEAWMEDEHPPHSAHKRADLFPKK